jgi:hypothetical protein
VAVLQVATVMPLVLASLNAHQLTIPPVAIGQHVMKPLDNAN